MMSEEDKKRIKEAKTCNSCLDWHKYCMAECCTSIRVRITPEELKHSGKTFVMVSPLRPDMQWYYKLHGVRYVHGKLIFEKKYCMVRGGKVYYIRRCKMLTDDLRCKGHPDNKPYICRALDENTLQEFHTKNCMYRYKNMEVENNGD